MGGVKKLRDLRKKIKKSIAQSEQSFTKRALVLDNFPATLEKLRQAAVRVYAIAPQLPNKLSHRRLIPRYELSSTSALVASVSGFVPTRKKSSCSPKQIQNIAYREEK